MMSGMQQTHHTVDEVKLFEMDPLEFLKPAAGTTKAIPGR